MVESKSPLTGREPPWNHTAHQCEGRPTFQEDQAHHLLLVSLGQAQGAPAGESSDHSRQVQCQELRVGGDPRAGETGACTSRAHPGVPKTTAAVTRAAALHPAQPP